MLMENLSPAPRATLHHPKVMQAAHDTVHSTDYYGGTALLAKALGVTPATLSNQVNQKQPGHKFGLEDSIFVQQFTERYDILHQYAAALGFSVIPFGDFSGISDVELLTLYADWHAELGDVNREVQAAFSDGRVEQDEYDRIEKEFIEAVATGHVFLSRLKALIDDKQPTACPG